MVPVKEILRLLHVRSGEEKLVVAMLGHFFLIALGRMFVYSAAYGLFLVDFGARALPVVYVITSVVATLTSLAYLRLVSRFALRHLLVATLGCVLAVTLALRFGLTAGSQRWLIFLLPVWADILWVLTNLEFWGLAGRLFDVRQGKRLFGLLTGGKQAGEIAGGLLVPTAVAVAGAPNLFLIAAVALAVTLLSLIHIVRTFGNVLISVAREAAPTKAPFAAVLRQRYVVLLFGQIVLGWIVFYAIDNIFFDRVAARYAGADELTSFLGLFFAAISFVTLLATIFLTGRILRRFGVGVTILVLPALLTAATAAIAASGVLSAGTAVLFWLAATARLFAGTFLYATDVPATNILYQPLPPRQRIQIQTISEGIVFPVSVGVAGLLLLLLRNVLELDVFELAGVLLALLGAWLILSARVGRDYPEMLRRALVRRGLGDARLEVLDRSSIQILRQALESPHPAQVLYALDRLQDAEPTRIQDLMIGLLEHPDPRVRQDVLERIEGRAMTAALEPVRRRLAIEDSRQVRGAGKGSWTASKAAR